MTREHRLDTAGKTFGTVAPSLNHSTLVLRPAMAIGHTSAFPKVILILGLAVHTFSLAGCPQVNRHGIKFTDPFEGNQVSKYTGGGELGEKWTRDSQCQVILNWLNKVKLEYPDLKVGDRGQVPPLHQYVNLFRDSSFVPVFGESYLSMAQSTKTNLWNNTLHGNGCIGWGQFKKYQKEFDPYRGVLETAFSAASREQKQLTSAVTSIHAEQDRIKQLLGKIDQSPLTIEAFEELRSYAKSTSASLQTDTDQQRSGGRTNRRTARSYDFPTASLWPSDMVAFQKVLDQKLQEIAQELAKTSRTEVAGLAESLENAQKIKDVYIPQGAQYSAMLVSPGEADSLKVALQSKLNSILTVQVKERVETLESIPNTVQGLEQSVRWHSSYNHDFSKFRSVPQVTAGDSAFAKKRNAILQETKPEFAKKLEALDPSLGSLVKADALLTSTLPLPVDQTFPSHQEYADLVATRQTRILDQLLAPVSDQLSKIPSTLSGAYKIIEWKREFDTAYEPHKRFKPVQDVLVKWRRKREDILLGAKGEFTQKQHALSPTHEGIKRATTMLDEVFPSSEDESLPLYEEYQGVVLSTIKDLKGRAR